MNLEDALRVRRLLAIVRGSDPDAALRTVITLADEGIDLVEISLTTTEARSVIARARKELGDRVLLGAGTAISAADAAGAFEAGASFLVTPGLAPALVMARERRRPVLAGALTPSEIAQASQQGAAAIKLFPASLGGVPYLRALRDPFPRTAFVPVGGVDATLAAEYLAAGATAVGVGSPLIADAASGGSLGQLRRRARHLLDAVHDGGAP